MSSLLPMARACALFPCSNELNWAPTRAVSSRDVIQSFRTNWILALCCEEANEKRRYWAEMRVGPDDPNWCSKRRAADLKLGSPYGHSKSNIPRIEPSARRSAEVTIARARSLTLRSIGRCSAPPQFTCSLTALKDLSEAALIDKKAPTARRQPGFEAEEIVTARSRPLRMSNALQSQGGGPRNASTRKSTMTRTLALT